MEYLTETSIGDMIKVIEALGQVMTTKPEDGNGKLATILKKSVGNGSQYKGSISSQANKLVMTFPILCSNTVTASTASMISKAVERKCVTMLQQIFASQLLVVNKNDKGALNKINDIYTGIDFDTLSVDDMIKITDTITAKQGKAFFEAAYVNEVAELSKRKVNAPVYESSISESPVALYMINNNGSAMEDLEMRPMQEAIDIDKYFKKTPRGTQGKEISKIGDVLDDLDVPDADWDAIINKAKSGDFEKLIQLNKDIRDRTGMEIDIDNLILAKAKDKRDAKMMALNYKKALQDYDFNRDRLKREIEKNQREKETLKISKERLALSKQQDERQIVAGKMDYFKKQLIDTDVKKVNELVPSLMVVNYAVDAGHGDLYQDSSIIGVKTRLIALDSFQILDKLASKNKDKSGFVKFIKATTGEIKFIKDFVLAIDKAKIDALSKSKRGSANPIWRVLERRAAINNLRKALGQKNDASPITTLVITQEEVDYLKKTADMDVSNVNVANFVLNAYNLMAICIVDETAEVAKFLFDGEFNQFDSYSFMSLQKEAGDNGMYKKVINLMAKRM